MKTITKLRCNITRTVSLLVDETQPIEEMVKMGKFTCKSEQVTSQFFPITEDAKIVKRKIVLLQFNTKIPSEVALAEMKKKDYAPITIRGLLALAVKDPDLQRQVLVVALGSVCEIEGVRKVAFIYGFDLSRQLRLYSFENIWGDITRFAAVRK